ncbi:MAG: hypothetical protein ACPHVN_00095 [Luminiphilus sp.]
MQNTLYPIGYRAAQLNPRAIHTATLPAPDTDQELSHAVLRHGAKRPAPAFTAAFSPEGRDNLREIMLDAIYIGAYAVTGEHYEPLLYEDFPATYKAIHSPQWTLATIDEALDPISKGDVEPLRPLWMRDSSYLPVHLRRISPRAAAHATGMSLAAFHRVAEKVSPFPIQEYGPFQRVISLQGYRSPIAEACTSVMLGPTKVSAGARRVPTQEFGLRLRRMKGTQEIAKPDERPLFLKLLERPSYGDDLNRQLLSLAASGAHWLVRNISRMDASEMNTRQGVLNEIAGWMAEISGMNEHGNLPSEISNPASPSNVYWEEPIKQVLTRAMSQFVSHHWEALIQQSAMPHVRTEDRAAYMLAYAMMRDQVHRRYGRYLQSMKASTLLAVSRTTGIPPGAFLNYFSDHYNRTGILLFSEGQAHTLLSLLEDEPARGGKQAQGRAELMAEVEQWIVKAQEMSLRPEVIDRVVLFGDNPAWGLEAGE